MINLIPESAKKLVHKEYIVRAASVGAFLLALALLASGVLLAPTYALYSYQIQTALSGEDVTATDNEAAFSNITATLAEANAFANQLSLSLDSVKASAILAHVEGALPPTVTLDGLVVTGDQKAMRIEARGTAATREALRTFTDSLKRDAFFLDAQVPISDLARDTNLTFTVALTLRTPS